MKYCFIQFLLLNILFASAQVTKRKVVDRQTNIPVAFATIKILGKPLGSIASDKGEFELNIEPTDSVLVSCVGYEQIILLGKNITPIVYLDRKIKTLSKITLSEKKFIRTVVLGNGAEFLDTKIKCDFNGELKEDCWEWGPSENKGEFAEKINLPDSTLSYKIRKIYFPLAQGRCPGALLLHIYLEDPTTGLPGEELLLKLLYLSKLSIRKNKVMIDLANENIYLQHSNSLFISFGWGGIPDDKKRNCTATIMLIRSDYSNTYSRAPLSSTYQWYKYGEIKLSKDEVVKMNTVYAVELDEMK